MFHLSSSMLLPGGGSSGSGRAARLTLGARVALLLFVALCVNPSSVAQSGNPLGSLLGNKSPAPANQTSPAQAAIPPAESQAPTAILLPDVATRAEELKRTLRDLANQLPTSEQL